ncbi:threonyl-tRNA synthetase [Coemansia sp. RSA 1972]|nr:threonyl-tRNA synthetase [Coemansia sp. RSA 1972]
MIFYILPLYKLFILKCLHEWVSDKLIVILGQRNKDVVEYVLHLASTCTDEQTLTQQLEAAELPRSEITAQFAHELFSRVPRHSKKTESKRESSKLPKQNRKPPAALADHDADEEPASRKDQQKLQPVTAGDNATLDQLPKAGIADTNEPAHEKDEQMGDDIADTDAQMDKDAADRDTFAERLKQKDKDNTNKLVEDRSTEYLKLREEQRLEILRQEIADKEELFQNQRHTEKEVSDLEYKCELLRLAEECRFILLHGLCMVSMIMATIRQKYAKYGFDEVSAPLMFNSQIDQRSYKDLPIRYADFSPLHRNEIAVALSGLTRVRKFHQDDGHIFCARHQVEGEIEHCLSLIGEMYKMFGFVSYEFALSTRPENYLGEVTKWDEAEAALKDVLNNSGRCWVINKGDGVFYGPKIDMHVQDVLGCKHQTVTIQLDFQLPQRFQLK